MTDPYSSHPPAPGYGHNAPYGGPQAHSQEEKNWAMMAHGIPLAAMWFSAGFLGFVGGIIVYVMAKDKGSLARTQAAQALNIQLNALIWIILSYALMLVLIGFILLPIAIIVATIFHVVALVKAGQGEIWKPPFIIDFIK